MKSKRPKISNHFGTSQILLWIKQQALHFIKILSNFSGKNKKFSEKIRKFWKKSEIFLKNPKNCTFWSESQATKISND